MSLIPREKPDLRARLHAIPHKPGVYLMRDRLNRVIYVGKAGNLRKRVAQYFLPSRKMTADLKTRALLDSVWDFEVHTVNSEPEALLLEGRLIKEFRPRYNISFRDDKRFLLVKVDLRDEWPRFRLTRFKGEEGARYFGPFAHAGALRQTLAFMRKKFGVLTFGRGNPSDRELKSSTYQVPMKLGDITAEQYRERVERASEFLAGQSKEMLAQLEEEMKAAAATLDFERAAELRNMLDDLRETTKPIHRYTRAAGHRLGKNIDPEADMLALKDALQLPTLPRRMECFDISNISTTHVVASMVCFIEGRAANQFYRRFRIRTVEGQDDFASMAEVVRRRYARVLLDAKAIADSGLQIDSPAPQRAPAIGAVSESVPGGAAAGSNESASESAGESVVDYASNYSQEPPAESTQALERRLNLHLNEPRRVEGGSPGEAGTPRTSRIGNPQSPIRLPDLVIVDGGKGQLGAACRELQRLGLHDLPIIGLAKEFEEIYRPARPQPLRLPDDSGALRLLQRIRDEAHRFANTYHQLLMKRRIAESILDDCPGVSQHRKQLLLRHFGSVARLRRATVDEIAATAGIGRKLAEQIAQFLAERAG